LIEIHLVRPQILLDADCDMVVTGSPSARHPAFNMVSQDENGLVTLASPPASKLTRRQDVAPLYDLTTVAYVSRPSHVLAITSVLEGRVRMLAIDRRSAVDIDDEFDLEVARLLCDEETGSE
jgi:CMP-N-acetylneuraminic acid synthetase